MSKPSIAATLEAFKCFRKYTGRERAKMLRRWHQLIMDNAEELATAQHLAKRKTYG
jgi:succinate-semialdehyde dehydrogenase / glutarate-semialdehyde dehydrogenase